MDGSLARSAVERPPLDVTRLYAEHAPFLGRVIQRLAGPGPHVDDLLQETFIVVFKKQRAFDGRAAVRTWLYAIASNLCLRHRRGIHRLNLFRSRLSSEAQEASAPPDQHLERDQSCALVSEVLDRLPFRQREVFVLYELEELEGAEIAAMLGVPLGTVWTRLHHARKKFEELMRRRLAREEV
jgi:RNA polymerase sigma-70 factor, ECF subfamily